MFLDVIKYCYPRDIYNLSHCIRGLSLPKKYLSHTSLDLHKVYLEGFSLPVGIWKDRFDQLVSRAITNGHINNITGSESYYPSYQSNYPEIQHFNSKTHQVYTFMASRDQTLTTLFLIRDGPLVLIHFQYAMSNSKLLSPWCIGTEPGTPVLSTIMTHSHSGQLLSQYHWNFSNRKPIGRHIRYDINFTSKNQTYAYLRCYDSAGYIVSVEYYNYLCWHDKKAYRKISLAVPEEIRSHLIKWRYTPISLLEGMFETPEGEIILHVYMGHETRFDSYQFQIISADSSVKEIICPDRIYCDQSEMNHFPNLGLRGRSGLMLFTSSPWL